MHRRFKQLAKVCLPVQIQSVIRQIKLKQLLQMGKGSYLHRSVQILGISNVQIGRNSCVGEHCWLNVNHRDGNVVAIDIGNNCWIGRGNFFSSGRKITISDYCLTAIDCKFISSSHVTDNPLVPYLTTGTTSDQSIFIGVNCFVGAGVTVVGNINIGHGSVIAANAFVIHDLPPFCIAVGNPARVVKRFSFSKNAWCELEALDDNDLVDYPDEKSYLNALSSAHGNVSMPWIAAGSDLGNL